MEYIAYGFAVFGASVAGALLGVGIAMTTFWVKDKMQGVQ